MKDSEINSLNDLRNFRSAPLLDKNQKSKLLQELDSYLNDADWFTIGIMAPSFNRAILVLKEIEDYFSWSSMKIVTRPKGDGPVFLKANQNTGDIHIRIEYGLGEGVLLGCQYNNKQELANTLGPFPLYLFKSSSSE